jgi:phenylalanyl-tRNA synthetase beta chain
VVEQPHAAAESKIRTRLLALGFDEAVSPTFISNADAQRFSPAQPVALENPLSEETPLLRNSLLPGMLNMLAWNFNRGASDLRLFEMGNVFAMQGDRVEEEEHACFAATGMADDRGFDEKLRTLDFFDLKGAAEAIFEVFETKSLLFDAPGSSHYHPGRSAKILLNGKLVGELGQLHPEVAAARKLKQQIWLAQLNLDLIFDVPLREPRYERLSRFQAVERDFSLLLDSSVSYERLQRAIEALGIPELVSVGPHELFRGAGVPDGKYSLLLRAKFQASDRTLRDGELARWSQQVIAAIEALGSGLRT